ncbi:thioesterase II family protein [Rhodococcus sp. 14-2470-1a]|uniref:thioesterase II family protein n=1 Tax=Rhodococcus sp. 14-2470-1a TaxID=2023150 RepID=UPI000B9C280D|nr:MULTISPECIES: alpha/beta fold hydrolase [unclassified Rhodococcus (in: high G+C Gram-positive bacteria)]OZD59825.1 thioesterase [Rhodococcus sp. 06-1059B-a]OZF56634.1 thioesterase [Rhodococcus sp. 14-2470-1a]
MTTSSIDTDLWLRRFGSAPETGPRLICLPHAGGSATYYFQTSRALASSMDVLAVQYPGRQDRRAEPFIDDIDRLADAVTATVETVADRPLILFGHSMGATIGYEVTARLEEKGIEPLALFASGRRAPSCIRSENVHRRDDAGIIAELRRLQGTGSDLLGDDEIIQMILPAVRADYRAVESYRPAQRPPLRTPIVAMTGDVDPQVSADEAAAWERHTTGGFTLHTYSGGHFYLDHHAGAILAEIRAVAS